MGFLEDKGRARTFYRYLSKVYDTVNPAFWTVEMREEALSLLDIDEGDRVLDVGCGTGFTTSGLVRRTSNIDALDQSEHQMEKAFEKKSLEDVRFARGDAHRLPYKDETFDYVVSAGSIEYWPDPEKALRDMRRVTKEGGEVLVVGPNEPDSALFRSLADAIMLFYDEEEATRMFCEAGWHGIENHLLGPKWNDDLAIVTTAEK
ncbi:methyltransferase domain-containing protein [Halorutilales archaeon Cl-col2-1]